MKLNDKIRGAIVGYAFGDAIGVGTEFMTRNEVRSYYPEGLRTFSQIIRDAHRSQWKRGEWTNDTVLMTRFLECILENGRFKLHALARNFKEWFDTQDVDVASVFHVMCHNPAWIENPIVTAHQSWSTSNYAEASNDSLHRSLVTALTSSREELMEHVRRITLMTHDDSRCVTTSKIMARMFFRLLHDEEEPGIDELKSVCLENDPRTLPYLKKAYEGDMEGLGIDDENSMTWTRVSMGAALCSFWHSDNAYDTIFKVVDMGGDADTNASLAGALAGLKYGYDALPEEVKKMPRLDYLLDLADRVTEHVEKNNIQ
ncbi:MAG: ADP-ribosylglycohydrolase family protein [Bacteroides sp.]|nr:ADP-ribosylglycohydrolase family protein [Bacteroides sp.]